MYLVTSIDNFIRWPEVIPIPDMTASTVTHALISSWISGFGEQSSVARPNTLTVLLEYIGLFNCNGSVKQILILERVTYPWPYTTLCLSLAKCILLKFAPSNYA